MHTAATPNDLNEMITSMNRVAPVILGSPRSEGTQMYGLNDSRPATITYD